MRADIGVCILTKFGKFGDFHQVYLPTHQTYNWITRHGLSSINSISASSAFMFLILTNITVFKRKARSLGRPSLIIQTLLPLKAK